jgi:glycosyltransferase involved in cell wall biosynthesis
MRVALLSKAMTVLSTRSKAELLAQHSELHLIVPERWPGYVVETGSVSSAYTTHRLPIALPGRNHFHFYRGLRGLLKTIKPDVLHVDEEPYSLVTAQAFSIAASVGCRVVAFTWQNLNKRYPPPFRWIESKVYRQASAIIAGNQEAIDVLRAKGYRGEAPLIPQFGIDAASILDTAPNRATGAHSALRVCYVGRLVPEKGIDTLIEALADVPDAVLEIVGTGPELERLQAHANARQLGTRLSFLGGKSSLEVQRYLITTDVLVLPSLTTKGWKEQFGRVLIEAMASGVAVVGSSSGEIPHVIGDAGLVFPEGNAMALAAALRQLADANYRKTLIARGLERCRRYTQEEVVKATLNVYEQAMRGPVHSV